MLFKFVKIARKFFKKIKFKTFLSFFTKAQDVRCNKSVLSGRNVLNVIAKRLKEQGNTE